MSVAQPVNKPLDASGIVTLRKPEKVRSLWWDAWRRLSRNYAALLGLTLIILNVLGAIFAPQISPYDYTEQNYKALNTAPQWIIDLFPKMKAKGEEGGFITVNNDFILGSDNLGRDLLSRIIYGSRVSLAVAFVGPFFSLMVGLLFGMISGYAGGRVDNIMMRIVDIMYAFPTLLLIIMMMAFFRASFNAAEEGTLAYHLNKVDSQFGGMLFIFIGIGLTSWMDTARLARGQVLSIREKEYVEAAVSLGVKDRSIIMRHIFPNIIGPIIVAETLAIPRYISFEAFLSFIGLGVNPPTPSWGSMIAEGSTKIVSFPNQALFPALALFIVMFAFNFMGDGLRDALDPRTKKTT